LEPIVSLIVDYWKCPSSLSGVRVRRIGTPSYPILGEHWGNGYHNELQWQAAAPGTAGTNMRPDPDLKYMSNCVEVVKCNNEVGGCQLGLSGVNIIKVCQTQVVDYEFTQMTTDGCLNWICLPPEQ
jgi:hypothetical protein